jgi:hypothetical protein
MLALPWAAQDGMVSGNREKSYHGYEEETVWYMYLRKSDDRKTDGSYLRTLGVIRGPPPGQVPVCTVRIYDAESP